MNVRIAGASVVALAFACGQSAGPPHPSEAIRAPLAAGIAALVGEAPIPVAEVAEVAGAEGVEPRVARDRLIADAVAASGAEASGRDRDPRVAWALEAVRARAVVLRIRAASIETGPPTDDEVAALTDERWRDVALSEQVKVVHAIVVRPKDPAQVGAARALAAQLAAVVSAAKTADDFDALAHSIPVGPFELRVERLPAFVADVGLPRAPRCRWIPPSPAPRSF